MTFLAQLPVGASTADYLQPLVPWALVLAALLLFVAAWVGAGRR